MLAAESHPAIGWNRTLVVGARPAGARLFLNVILLRVFSWDQWHSATPMLVKLL